MRAHQKTEAKLLLHSLGRLLHPERYPREGNADHRYWDGFVEGEDSEREWRRTPFGWSGDTIGEVGEWLQRELALRMEELGDEGQAAA